MTVIFNVRSSPGLLWSPQATFSVLVSDPSSCLLARAEWTAWFLWGRDWVFLVPHVCVSCFQSSYDQRAQTVADRLEKSPPLAPAPRASHSWLKWCWSRTQTILQPRRVKFCVSQTWAHVLALPFLCCGRGCIDSSQPQFPDCKMVIEQVHVL